MAFQGSTQDKIQKLIDSFWWSIWRELEHYFRTFLSRVNSSGADRREFLDG
jgi:hypothetical protein